MAYVAVCGVAGNVIPISVLPYLEAIFGHSAPFPRRLARTPLGEGKLGVVRPREPVHLVSPPAHVKVALAYGFEQGAGRLVHFLRVHREQIAFPVKQLNFFLKV